MHDYDVIVLGGGSAGSSAAAAATEAGARTAMINRGELGGLCILRGCMPTKAMLASADAVHAAERLEPFGARLEGRVVPDFARIMERKGAQVARFQRAKIDDIESSDYEVLSGEVRFAPGGGVDVDGRRLTARSYVIATGSEPIVRPIPGIEEVPVWTSDDVMEMTEQPRSLLVLGGGPIGLELAQFFARIGTDVLVVQRSPLLGRYDAETGAELQRALEAESRLAFAMPGRIEELRADGPGLVATIRDGESSREHRADGLLMAVGRRAALGGLGLEHVGLEPTGETLEHDLEMRTARPEIFVAGDASGSHQLLHLSNAEGRVAGHNAAGGRPARRIDYRLRMQVVFTDPPWAQIGATESTAKADGHDLVVGRSRLPETGRAITMETRHGLWKVLADRASSEILGSALVGPRADDLIHLIAVLMHHRAKVADLREIPWYHPTLSEVMINVRRDLERRLA